MVGDGIELRPRDGFVVVVPDDEDTRYTHYMYRRKDEVLEKD